MVADEFGSCAMLTSARLPLRFDPARLSADLARIEPGEWVPHFNADYFQGDWSGVALRAPESANSPLSADPHAQHYLDTPVLGRCAFFRQVVAEFHCTLRTVRLLKLSAGSSIREHRDYELGFDAGEVRIHVPVATNAGVEFYLDGQRVMMEVGECWYLNLNLPHRVENHSATDRIHLVIDCVLNDWLRDLILEKGEVRSAGPECGFEQFRRRVLADPALQTSLQAYGERAAFSTAVVQLGAQHGYRFSAGDVDAAMQAGKRAWRQRNI